MPKKKKWRVLRDFEWCPKPYLVMVFRAGEIRSGLTRACIEHAGDRLEEVAEKIGE